MGDDYDGELPADPRVGAAAQFIYSAARYALDAGLTRSEFDALCGFWWGQAGADHAQEVVAMALRGSRDDGGERG